MFAHVVPVLFVFPHGRTSPSAADLSRKFGFDLPAIMAEQNHSPDLRDCCARSTLSRAAGTIRYASVQQKNPALWRGLSGLWSVYLFDCLLHRSFAVRYVTPFPAHHYQYNGRCCVDVGAPISGRVCFSSLLCGLHAHASGERRAL